MTATTTAQTIAEFIIASALHYGPGPHPDGSPQGVHAGGARADTPAGRPRPKPGTDQIGFDLDVPPPAVPAPADDAGQAAAEAVRQQVLAVAADYGARVKELDQTARALESRQKDLQAQLWSKRGDPLSDIPKDDPRLAAWEDTLRQQSQAHVRAAELRAAQKQAVNKLIETTGDLATDPPGYFTNAAALAGLGGSADSADIANDWGDLGDVQRKSVVAGLRQFNRLVGAEGLTGNYSYDVRFGPADPAKGYGQRAYYSSSDNSVRLTTSSSTTTVIHELGHSLEAKTRGLNQYARAFVARRTAGAAARPLAELQPGAGYDPSEQAKLGKFRDVYVGKVYAHGATEAISMGLEYMATDPVAFAKQDPDHFRFTYTVMRGTWRQP